jgi:photosystem II stability/assembly factor-like uncharacterized protein
MPWFRLPKSVDPRATAAAVLALLALLVAAALPARAADVWQALGPSGGNVAALAVDPQDGNTVYAGTLEAGVYRSANGGRSWQPAGLEGGVAHLAVAPNRAVYAVAAETLFLSRDRGASWVSLSAGLLAAAGKPKVHALALSPTLGTLFVVAGNGGDLDREILKSTDGGNSWTVAWVPPVPSILHQVWTDPTDPKLVFAAATSGTYVSADGGSRWTPTDLRSELFGSRAEALGLAVEVGPRHRILAYIRGDEFRNFTSAINISSDRGRTWRPRNTLDHQPLVLLRADPTVPGAFVAVTGQDRELFRTTDAGLHWTALGKTPPFFSSYDSSPDLAFDPHRPGVAFLATFGLNAEQPVWKTASFGAAWTPFNRGLFANDFLSVTANPRDPSTLWAVIDFFPWATNRSVPALWKSTDRGATWAPGGTSAQPISDFVISGNGKSLFLLYDEEVERSDDGGQSWTKLPLPLFNLKALANPPEEPDTLYVLAYGNSDTLGVSLDGGATWATRPLAAQFLAVTPGSPATLYANTKDLASAFTAKDGVQRSTDRGATWTTILTISGGSVSSIGLDPADPRRIVVTYYRADATGRSAVLWTADGGATWSPGVVPPEVRVVVGFLPDPLVPHGFLMGTDAGAFASADGGATWAPLGQGLPRTAFTRLSLDPSSPRTVYAATKGGGIYRLERTEP